MFWLWEAVLVALILRAPFVGIVVEQDRVVRRSWLRKRTWGVQDIASVGSTNYSGLLNFSSTSRGFLMLSLELIDGSVVHVREVTGRPAAISSARDALRRRLSLPHHSVPRRHRADEPSDPT